MVKIITLFFSTFLVTTPVQADARILHLQQRILERVPDLPVTRDALGRGDQERSVRALAHAKAIVAASDHFQARWDAFVIEAGWTHFSPYDDLPALIAAITYRESAFQSIVRLDDNSRQRNIPIVRGRAVRVDAGVMQVRAPSRPARVCGVERREDVERLLTDLHFSYRVGVCVLTNRLEGYIEQYQNPRLRRLRWNERPAVELRFYGVFGPRQNTAAARLARELIVIERYNWGGTHLYHHRTGAGYARRILQEFEFFRSTPGSS